MMGQGDSDGKSQKLIEDNLRRVYQQTLEEDVPDRFKDLLSRLKDRKTPDATAHRKDGDTQ